MKRVLVYLLFLVSLVSAESGSGVSPKGSLDLRKEAGATPSLSFKADLIDLSGNTVFTGGDEIILPVSIANSGKGEAQGVKVVLSGTSALVGLLGNGKIIGSIPPGTTRYDTLSTIVPTAVAGEQGRTVTVRVEEIRKEWSPTDAPSFTVALQPKAGATTQKKTYIEVDQVPSPRATDENAVGVVIGISKYREDGVPEVTYAQRDAQTMKSYLENVCGVKSTNIFALYGDHATKGDLDELFGTKLPLKVRQGGTVYIYFAGHGAPGKNGQPYLVAYDATASTETKLYAVQDLVKMANDWKAQKTIVMLDVCFAGKNRVLPPTGRPFVPPHGSGLRSSAKCVVLTASDSTQTANDLPDEKHGLFTYYLLKALQGDADNNPNDGWISLQELYDYVRKNVSEEAADRLQTAQDPMMILPPDVEQSVLGWRIAKSR